MGNAQQTKFDEFKNFTSDSKWPKLQFFESFGKPKFPETTISDKDMFPELEDTV